MTKQITLEEFEEIRDRNDSPKRRAQMTTLRCMCGFESCKGWCVEDPSEPWFPRPWQALPEFVGPLETNPEMADL